MKKKAGVTMVTLIITISILAILAGISVYTVISENNKTIAKTKELKKEIDDKNIDEKRKIIKTTFNIQNISGEYRMQIYDKSGNIVYDKKILDIFGKGILNGIN